MILIETKYKNFAEYIGSLSKSARKNYKHATKLYAGCYYGESQGFDTKLVREFMLLWQRQLVRGKHPEWAFPVEHVESLFHRGELRLFQLVNAHGAPWAMHFIQKRDGYWECHPPMYDKSHTELGTMMWFCLINYAILHFEGVPLDMGGGSDDWVYNLENRAAYPNTRYKWRFVPEKAKENPSSQKKYYIGRPLCKLLSRD